MESHNNRHLGCYLVQDPVQSKADFERRSTSEVSLSWVWPFLVLNLPREIPQPPWAAHSDVESLHCEIAFLILNWNFSSSNLSLLPLVLLLSTPEKSLAWPPPYHPSRLLKAVARSPLSPLFWWDPLIPHTCKKRTLFRTSFGVNISKTAFLTPSSLKYWVVQTILLTLWVPKSMQN